MAMTGSDDLDVEHRLDFLVSVLPAPPARILEVTCHRWPVTGLLAERGYRVSSLGDDNAARLRQRFLEQHGERYDVVLFSRSLHRMPDLDATLGHARTLLDRDGCVVAEEFAHDRADRATAAWFYETRTFLENAGMAAPSSHVPPTDDPLARWHLDHAGCTGLHAGTVLLATLARHFTVERVERCPQLYECLGDLVAGEPRARVIAARMFALEHVLLAENGLTPVGLRVVARHKDQHA
ncbi:methyltransferase domain-containing protein [Amycolatopsis anabasis]|uniref:methyltransferase domain-containing protein n=1 Tax=Amycolatopsis anabasis TaxID=1840409 RepID=UPI00131D4839|nr:methyltransferase domain-containing protein [Amycolatopsis anabasis]